MDEGKIVLMNLSQGKLGEDNAALLGAMFITKFQLAAMNRVYLSEDERKDFYLYVDEFQNFATSSFIKILSEARKYRLNLLLANQYIGQIPEEVRLAIFGNCGTMMSFLVGAGDSPYLAKEFAERFKEEDILALANYQSMTKMMIDGRTSPPFMNYTLPLPMSRTQNREKVVQASKERYMKPIKKDNIESKFEEGKRMVKEAEAKEAAGVKTQEAKTAAPTQAKPVEQPQIASVERKEGPASPQTSQGGPPVHTPAPIKSEPAPVKVETKAPEAPAQPKVEDKEAIVAKTEPQPPKQVNQSRPQQHNKPKGGNNRSHQQHSGEKRCAKAPISAPNSSQ